MVTFTETRSARAIAIDRSITTKQVYGGLNQQYVGSPKRSDAGGYDTRGTKGVYVPLPEQKEKEKTTGEYVPTEQEKAELLPRFYQLDPLEQHKDLLVTKNVIKRKSDVGKWKKNPKYYDVRNIDTQPEELIPVRIATIRRFSGNPEIISKNFRWTTLRGKYSFNRNKVKEAGKIEVTTQEPINYQRYLSHELGHAYDLNMLSHVSETSLFKISKGNAKTAGNVNFEYRSPKILNKLSFGKANNLMLKIGDMNKKMYAQVERVTRERINPYDKLKVPLKTRLYRISKEELFADWFSGFITNKPLVKKESKKFYNGFKKQNKPLFKALRASDFGITKRYIRGMYGKTYWIMPRL